MGAFIRALRLAVPIGAMILTGTLQAHPNTIGLLPVLGGAGKWARDTYPNSTAVQWLPF